MRAVFVVLLLAGCAGAPADPEPDAFQDLKASSDKGVIRGLVVDEAIRPLVGATVRLEPGQKETMTDGDGAFGFADLDPGVYFLVASAPFYTSVQASTEVVAGVDRPDIVRIALQALPRPEPAIQELVQRFFMDGSVWVAGVGGVVAGGFLGEGTFRHTHDIGPNVTFVQSELVWDAEQPLATAMRLTAQLRDADNGGIDTQVVNGPSPLLQAFDEEQTTPETARIFYELFVRDGTAPVGITAAQSLEMFTHVFQHFVPNDGWRFTQDGQHPVPPPP